MTEQSSDMLLALSAKDLLNAYVEKSEELRQRGILVAFSMTNGTDGEECKLVSFQATKQILK